MPSKTCFSSPRLLESAAWMVITRGNHCPQQLHRVVCKGGCIACVEIDADARISRGAGDLKKYIWRLGKIGVGPGARLGVVFVNQGDARARECFLPAGAIPG